MKVIAYILTIDGEVPAYVTDGGYFPKANGDEFPQDLTLVGVATDDASETEFVDADELADYVAIYSPTIYNPELRQDESAAVVVARWWENHVS